MLARLRPATSPPFSPGQFGSFYQVSKNLRLTVKYAISPKTPSITRRLVTCAGTLNSPASNQELFRYTSGRYLYNERLRLAERYVEFNIEALKKVASQSVNRERVVCLRKLAEGGFNRVLLLTMNDGLEVIVKIPYSIAIPKKLTTESEVATLEFLRSKGIPVPRVYAWSSDSENEVGSEYIIMEKAPGKPLEKCWFSLTPKERVNLVTSYVEVERKLFSIHFGAYGSLHFRDSLSRHLQADLYASDVEDVDGDSRRFCIGPAADYMFWREKRADFEMNRGPCMFPLLGLICAD